MMLKAKDIESILAPPSGAHVYVKRFFKAKELNNAEVARTIGVNSSTVKRFLDGGSLSEMMAAKLYLHYKMDIQTLFNLEAKAKTFKARAIVSYHNYYEALNGGLISFFDEFKGSEDQKAFPVSRVRSLMLFFADSLDIKEFDWPENSLDKKCEEDKIANVIYDLIENKILAKTKDIQELEYVALPFIESFFAEINNSILYGAFSKRQVMSIEVVNAFFSEYKGELSEEKARNLLQRYHLSLGELSIMFAKRYAVLLNKFEENTKEVK